ncbi:biotin/lipoate A/B protein ligase family protein [Lentisphaerota bacterium ZTH]|nr:lipoate--protein ligase family protein [Lentisphaerota bacterium]WET07665.1 biotin/lipoate A/B protein ligase family protein [Lentisphaerota bacterium ZTH]
MNNADNEWFLWLDNAHSPQLNMSIDEILLNRIAAIGKPLLRIYKWDRPSVTIGYVQSFDAAPHDRYTVVRRPTGGGVVYHDSDLTYTVIIPPGHDIAKLDRLESYHVFHRAILLALAELGLEARLAPDESSPVDRATMQCFVTPTRYDVIAAGRKYAGAAQRRTRSGVLHQGSIDLKAAAGDENLLKQKLIAAFEKQFNINFIDFTPDTQFIKSAEELAIDKYATDDWNCLKKHGKR